MNTPRPPSPDAALTPEERALADRIAQTRPPREPSPALDARILAAARAAATPARSSNASAHPRARRRWPAATAVAATLVLAVGIAWQLRPVEDVRVEYSEAPSAAARVVTPPGGPRAPDDTRQAVDETVAADEAAAASVAPPPEAEAAPRAEPASQPAPRPAAESAGSRQPQAPVEPQVAPAGADTGTPIVFDQPSPMDSAPASEPRPTAFPATAATPAPPPPPAPVAPASAPPPEPMRTQAISAPAADAAASEAFRAARARSESKAAPAPAARTATAIGTAASDDGRAMAAPKAGAGTLDRIEVSGSRIRDFDDQSLDEQPPASADSPQVQQAWLQRVRELLADGETDAARDSLREYRRRYPRADLPDDLRALLDE